MYIYIYIERERDRKRERERERKSSEGKFTISREIEPVRRSFCRHGSRTFMELARLAPSGPSSAPGKKHQTPKWESRITQSDCLESLSAGIPCTEIGRAYRFMLCLYL